MKKTSTWICSNNNTLLTNKALLEMSHLPFGHLIFYVSHCMLDIRSVWNLPFKAAHIKTKKVLGLLSKIFFSAKTKHKELNWKNQFLWGWYCIFMNGFISLALKNWLQTFLNLRTNLQTHSKPGKQCATQHILDHNFRTLHPYMLTLQTLYSLSFCWLLREA